jgi:hypothetical protein
MTQPDPLAGTPAPGEPTAPQDGQNFPVQSGVIPPTQTVYPWRSAVRTGIQTLLALCAVVPTVTGSLNPEKFAWAAGAATVAGGIARVFAIPAVEEFLGKFGLSAEPK